jgi:DNA-damage-inducible protein J
VGKPTVSKNTRVHADVGVDVLKRATQALSRQGLTVPRAIQLMLEYVVLEGELPLDFFEPNAETKEAMEEAKRGDLKSFHSVEELMADLNAED